MNRKSSIAVIGGGIEGLLIAYYLSQNKNLSLTLFEKETSLGGLLSGFKPTPRSDYLEKYYHHWFRTDTDLMAFLKKEKLDKNIEWFKSSTAIYQKGTLNPFMTPLDLLKYPHLNLLDKLRLGLCTLYLQKTKNWKNFEGITAHRYLQKICGKKAYQTIWEPLLKGKFNSDYKKVSMSWMWSRIYFRGRSKPPGDPIEKLAYYQKGTQILLDQVAKKLLKNKLKIRLSTPVTKIEKLKKGYQVVSPNQKEKFDRVICALPTPVFLKICPQLPPDYLTKLKSSSYLGAICLVLLSKKSISPYYWTNISDPSFPFLALVEHTNLVPRSRYQNHHVFYLGHYLPADHPFFSFTSQKIFNHFFPYLKKLNPSLTKKDIKKYFFFKNLYAQHLVPKNFSQNIPSYQTPHPGLYLANFTQIFPEDRGTSAAIREAKKVADLVIKNL
jgi:protoporphyrinogen oxidase